MTNAITQKPLQVSTDGTVWSSLIVPVSQLDEVRQLFDRGGIEYWVGEHVISFNGAPEEAFIRFKRGTDPTAIQAILDRVR